MLDSNYYSWYAIHIETDMYLYVDDNGKVILYDEPMMFKSRDDVEQCIRKLGIGIENFEILNEEE